MKSKKPFGIIALIIFLVWGVFKSISMLFHSGSIDVQLLSVYNVSFFYYVYILLVIIFGIYLVYAFWKAKKAGYKAFFWFSGIHVVYTLLAMIMSLFLREKVIDFYTKSRLDRGLSVDNIEMVTRPGFLVIGSITTILLYLTLSYYVFRKKNYFFENK